MSKLKVLALGLALSGTAAGCTTTVRAVTHVGAYGPKDQPYLYIGYAENKDVSRVRKCTVKPDNAIDCQEQGEVNKLLNEE